MDTEPTSSAAYSLRPRVGVVGLGRMGSRIAMRLARSGLPIVGFGRKKASHAELERVGGRVCESPAAIATDSDLVFTAVSGPADVREVTLGRLGIVRGGHQGLIIVDVSTIDPLTSREIAAEVRLNGMDMLDAPMSGSVHDAESGTLGFLVGGRSNTLERARTVLEMLGTVHYFGTNGNGCRAKLALNLLLAAMVQSLGEAFRMLDFFGLPLDLFLTVVKGSGLCSPVFERVGSRVLVHDLEPRFCLADLQKDILLLNDLANEASLDLRCARLLKEVVLGLGRNALSQDYAGLVLEELKRPIGPAWKESR